MTNQKSRSAKVSGAFLSEVATWLFGLVELGLAFRFVLKLLGARSTAPVVAWVYETTEPLLQPFLLAFPTPSVRGGFSLEFTTLFAIFTYAFIGYLVQELLDVLGQRRP